MDFEDLSEKEQKLVVSSKYHLFRDKCIKLKEKGVDACVDDDDFDLKGVNITEDARDLIDLAVPQIINYKGLTFDRPLEGLSIGGFYYFMYLFYFERRRQLASRFEGYTMDSMLMKQSITGDEMWLVNKVDKIPDEVIEKYKNK
ncbi:MAG: hypothetical protein CMD22_05915 [Flavobacteriales bacterium]|nr:hypothetical protein [Flavobacteriales bacterium]|tara:strand:+ start:2041 stop:2472 length:432 start_codon:yes stop_codon:yes gene_type:complete